MLLAMGPLSTAAQFKQEIDTVVGTFHTVQRPILRAFREPTERAFILMLPRDWDWKGSIFRSATCPGSFVWTAQSKDGLTGAFEAEPGYWQTPWTDAQGAAGGFALQSVAARIPGATNLRPVAVQQLPRAARYLAGSTSSSRRQGSDAADRAASLSAEVGTRPSASGRLVPTLLPAADRRRMGGLAHLRS